MTCEEAGCYEVAIISIRKDPFGKSDAMRHLCSHHAPRWLAVSGQVNEKAIGGSDVCHTCAAHVKVITEDLEPRIRALEAGIELYKVELAVANEGWLAADKLKLDAQNQLSAELALRQTAEAYAARNALRVIELEAVLREILDKGARVDGWTAQRSASMWAGEARALLAVAETKGEQG